MDEATNTALNRALELLRAGDRQAARQILANIVKQSPDIEQAWFLLGIALTDREQQKYAFQRVLRINPANEKAKQRLAKIAAQEAPASPAQPKAQPFYTKPEIVAEGLAPEHLQEEEKPEPVQEKIEEKFDISLPEDKVVEKIQPEKRRLSNCLIPAFAFLFVVVVFGGGALYYLVQNNLIAIPGISTQPAISSVNNNSTTPEPDSISGARELPPTWTPEPTLTPSPTNLPTATPTITYTPTALPLAPGIVEEMNMIQQQVSDLRGLPITGEVTNYLYPKMKIEQIMRDKYLTDELIPILEDEARVLIALGLIKPTYDIVQHTLNARADNIGGFFVPEGNEIFIVGSVFTGIEKYVYSHEYDHALVDQHFDLANLGVYPVCIWPEQRCQAIQSVVEGDASLMEILWWEQYATEQDYREIMRYNPPPQLFAQEEPPPFVGLDLMFPYLQGLLFVDYFFEEGHWTEVNTLYGNLPTTTEQVMHPEKYVDGEQGIEINDRPLSEALGEGWREIRSDALGEWKTFLLLAYGADEAAQLSDDVALQAAAGWGGDRYQIYHNPETDGVVLSAHWLWDTPEDSDEFHEAISAYVFERFRGAVLERPGNGSCWSVNQDFSCIFKSAQEVLWVLAPDQESLEAVLSLYPKFR